MTPLDAAGFAVLALRNRRLAVTILRVLAGRGTVEDHDALPPRNPGEPALQWAWRSRQPPEHPRLWTHDLDRAMDEAQRQLDCAARLGISAIPFGSADYPSLLAEIGDPPPVLWVRGQPASCAGPAVAIVGSRAATPYGLTMARRLASDLAAAGVIVISGLARGIDSAAHAAVVAAHGRTIGVLGCGLDRVYPAEHKGLAADIQHTGAIVSEFPPGVPPLPHHFPMRNRIISGLSLAVVVVEAAEKSGALITASAAGEQGRDVMVVPGPATGGRNRGGHLLIRDGARVVETAADILEELGNDGFRAVGTAPPPPAAALPDALDFTVDDVAARTGESPGAVLARLLDLELTGRVQRLEGGRFIRVLT